MTKPRHTEPDTVGDLSKGAGRQVHRVTWCLEHAKNAAAETIVRKDELGCAL
jgi:hypothetical protein